MQEINLLQNKIKDRTLSFERGNRLVIIIFTLVIILEMAALGGLYFLSKVNTAESAKLEAENMETEQALNLAKADLTKAQGVQAQLINIKTLLNNRVIWTPFFENISSLTAKQVQYSSITGSNIDGKVNLQGTAVSYLELGKLILSINSSGKFSDVKLLSVSPSSGKTFGYGFSLEAKAKPDNFKKTK